MSDAFFVEYDIAREKCKVCGRWFALHSFRDLSVCVKEQLERDKGAKKRDG